MLFRGFSRNKSLRVLFGLSGLFVLVFLSVLGGVPEIYFPAAIFAQGYRV